MNPVTLASVVTTALATRLIDRFAASQVLNPSLEARGVGLPLSTFVFEDTLVRLSRETNSLVVFPYPPKRVYGSVLRKDSDGRPHGVRRFLRKPSVRPNPAVKAVLRYPLIEGVVMGSLSASAFAYAFSEPQALAPLLGGLSGLAAVAVSRRIPNPLLGVLLSSGSGWLAYEAAERVLSLLPSL